VELAQRCLMGDAGALHEFVEVYRPAVFSLCFRMLRHHQDAEDTTQESLARALRYLKSWDSTQPLTPWVMKIAANRCRTSLERRARIPTPRETIDDVPDATTDRLSLGEELQLALTQLVEHQRECFSLFYQQDRSIAEIAGIMHVPEGTIKTWLYRSRRQLAQHLRDRGITPQQRIKTSSREQ